jgi:hypothetical protein
MRMNLPEKELGEGRDELNLSVKRRDELNLSVKGKS